MEGLNRAPEDLEGEAASARTRGGAGRKARYPSSRDVVEAVARVARAASGVHPDEFPDLVLESLRNMGFDVRHVTIKRIWSAYEKLVKRGAMPDYLGVLER